MQTQQKTPMLKIAHFLRKNVNARTVRFLVLFYLIGRIPFLRDFFSCYASTIDPDDIKNARKIDIELIDQIPITKKEFCYLSIYNGYFGNNLNVTTLTLERSFNVIVIPNCLILPRTPFPVYLPFKKTVVPSFRKVGRTTTPFGRYRNNRRLSGTIYSLLSTTRGAKHYFHFFFDQVIAFLAVYARWNDNDDVRLLVRKDIPSFQKPALEYISSRFPNVHLETVDEDETIECDQFISVHSHLKGPINYFCQKEYLDEIRNIYYDYYKINRTEGSSFIYVSRNKQKIRQTTNESAVIAALTAHGFEVVTPESLAHTEQVSLFSNAQVVIGTTGAALTNLLFCRPGCHVIEIRPANLNYPLYFGLCKQMDLHHHYFEGSAMNLNRAFKVDVDALDSLVSDIVGAIRS